MRGQQAGDERSLRTGIPAPACPSGLDERLAVVVAGVADDGVDVVGAALRGVLDQKRRALDAVVGRAAVGRRPVPGEVGVVDLRLVRGQAARGGGVGQDVDPGADQLQEDGPLVLLE